MSTSRIKLPEWWPHALLPLEELLWRRRSVREFARRPLSLQQVAQLLWVAQGVSEQTGLRTAPSACRRALSPSICCPWATPRDEPAGGQDPGEATPIGVGRPRSGQWRHPDPVPLW